MVKGAGTRGWVSSLDQGRDVRGGAYAFDSPLSPAVFGLDAYAYPDLGIACQHDSCILSAFIAQNLMDRHVINSRKGWALVHGLPSILESL